MYETVIVSDIKMLRWVPNPPPVLRAWVENPFFGKFENEPVYFLAEIMEANMAGQWARVLIVGEASEFNMPFHMIHCVHEFDEYKNKVVKVHGEPKAEVL